MLFYIACVWKHDRSTVSCIDSLLVALKKRCVMMLVLTFCCIHHTTNTVLIHSALTSASHVGSSQQGSACLSFPVCHVCSKSLHPLYTLTQCPGQQFQQMFRLTYFGQQFQEALADATPLPGPRWIERGMLESVPAETTNTRVRDLLEIRGQGSVMPIPKLCKLCGLSSPCLSMNCIT